MCCPALARPACGNRSLRERGVKRARAENGEMVHSGASHASENTREAQQEVRRGETGSESGGIAIRNGLDGDHRIHAGGPVECRAVPDAEVSVLPRYADRT